MAALYVVLLSGIPSAVMSLLVTAVAALTWPVLSTVTLYSLLSLAVYLGWVYLFAPAVTPSSFVLSAALIRPSALVVAALYVVSLSGIPSAVMSLLATAVAALTWPVPSTVTLYSPLALAV